MKAFTIAFVLLATAATVFAFNPTARGNRIAVLDMAAGYPSSDAWIAQAIETRMCDELRSRGFEAYAVPARLDEVTAFDPANADYYVEIRGSGGATIPVGDAAIAAGNVAVDIGVLISHMATQVRLYDGRSLELLQTFDLEKRSTAVVPTGFGLWSGHLAFSIAAPARWLQDRSVMRRIAVDAASNIARELNR